ncbi:nardilysin-like [Dysidea avara]|uniref:nardilysin-like n=1 Tax=Dysidea avara TaxID=196820 RepID=UPI00332D6C53
MMSEAQHEVTKSPYDPRDYKVITLANGITALLISDQSKEEESDLSHSKEEALDVSDNEEDTNDQGDASSAGSCDEDTPPGSNQSAAALCVGVGSFSDPKDVQGLAHFLEHMVFMGSNKYPEENGFDAFITKHGGYSNASTDCERTIFQFSIPPEHFQEGLDMFAHFFVHPLLNQSSVDREIEAVDSEFHLASQVDGCRLQQLWSHIAVDNHPMANFLWGNHVSLKKNPSEQGINTHDRVKQFYSQYYCSKYMTLAVMSQDSLGDLERWVTESFSGIPNCDRPRPSFSTCPKPFDNSFCRLYKVSPIKDTHELHITWCLPPLQDQYKVKPLHYISWLVGHEGTGSIMALLKKKHYATFLEAGNSGQGFELNTSHSLFQCCITLTDKGYDNIVECCSIVFQYIKMLQSVGVVQRVFKEIQSLDDSNFKFRESEEPVDYVEWVSEAMQLYPSNHYLNGRFLLFDYQPEVIKRAQDMLTPETANIVLMSPRVSGECTLQEPWFGASYCVQDVPADWMEQWKNLPLHPDLHVPSENPFIPTDFQLKTTEQHVSKHPQAIKDTPHYKLWYRQDDVFNLPRARAYLHFITPLPSYSPEGSALLDLMIEVLLHNVAEVGYQAEVAQLSYSLVAEKSGLVMKLHGFNHKISLLLETLIDHMMSCDATEDAFIAIKSELKKSYHNETIKAKKLSRLTRLKIIQLVNWSTVDKLEVIDGISLAKLRDFIQQFKQELFVEALVQGNVTSQEAISMIDYVASHLNYRPLPSHMRPQFRTMELPRNQSSLWQQPGLNPLSPNTAIVNYYQCCHSDIKAHTLTQLLMHCMDEPCFDVLRTKSQLGYDVRCLPHLTNGILGFSVAVVTQANKFSVREASNKMLQFVDQFYDFLSDMSDDDFQDHVTAMIHTKLEQDTSLEQEVTRHWEEVISHHYVFDRRQREVTILRGVSRDDLIGWFKRNTKGDEDLRLLRVQILGHGDKEDGSDQSEDITDGGVIPIADINKFKQSLSVHPVTMTTS